jgi:hypothetical protein
MSVGISGIIGMPGGLNKKFEIKELIEGTSYIVMYRKMQCNEKLNAVCPLQPCIAGYLMPGCPLASVGSLACLLASRINSQSKN